MIQHATISSGHIPDAIKIFARKEIEHTTYMGETIRASAAMVVASGGGETNARCWVTNPGRLDSLVCTTDKAPFTLCPNDPIPYLQFIGLEVRSEGGRAYKVITPDGYLVDLREDVFLDVLFHQGIPKDGFLEGHFRWVRLGSAIRLAWMGGELYKEIVTLDHRKKTPNKGKIKSRDLVIGGVYGRGAIYHEYGIFLGFVRMGGKKRLAWREIYHLEPDLQACYDLDYMTTQQGIYSYIIRVTGSCSYQERVGTVQLKPVPTLSCYWRNGYGEDVSDDFKSWV